MGFLKLIGAVSAAEHEREIEVLEDLLDESRAGEELIDERFKKAITDLASQTEKADALQSLANGLNDEFEKMVHERNAWQQTATTYAAEIAALRPDAEAMRKKRRDDVARAQAKRDAARRVARPLTAPTKAVAVKGKAK